MILRLVYATETGLIMIRDETSTRIVGNEIQWFEIAYGVIKKFRKDGQNGRLPSYARTVIQSVPQVSTQNKNADACFEGNT